MANDSFIDTICSLLYNDYEILIYPSDIHKIIQTSYLWPVIKVIDRNGFAVQYYRTFFSEPQKLCSSSGIRSSFWEDECIKYEQHQFHSWDVPFLGIIAVKSEKQDMPIAGIPALHCENGIVAVRVFFSYNSASFSHAEAIQKLLEDELAERLGWELEEIVLSANILHKCKSIWPEIDIVERVKSLVVARTLQLPEMLPCDESAYKILLNDASMNICKSIAEVKDALEKIINSHEHCRLLLMKKNMKYGKTYLGSIHDELCDSLNRYCEAFLLVAMPVAYCLHIPLILKEFTTRIEIAYNDPVKYRMKMKTLSFLTVNIERIMEKKAKNSYQIQRKKDALLIMIENFIINQFTTQTARKFVKIQLSDIEEKIEELHHVLEISETQH
jgi:predicted nucleic acid-binding protein